jgi:multidrug efflux pump subunit AcrB
MTVASNLASVQIQLHREPLRKHSATELERMWRAKVGEISGTESISYSAEQFARGTDIEYELSHPDEETLVAGVESLRDYLASLPEVYDIQDSFKLGKRQYDVELTSVGKAAGLTSSLVARQLRMNFFGEEVQRIQRGRQELKVMVRYPSDERRSMQDLYNARIRLADGTETSLRTVATLTESRGYSSIDRVDGARIVLVSAQIDTAMATPTEVNDVLQQEVLPALQEEYRGLKFKQAGRSQAQAEDMASLGGLALVALLVIYVMIASQLRSYAQPLVIMSAVPFGAGGALIGHFVLGFDLSFVSVFGIIALSGVVVNDSLILIDRYNRFRRESDLEPIEAIIAATQRRFRPIVLTTVTTALGLTPMLFETSIQAQFMIPMAVSLATGIVFASVIILFVVPILVLIEEDLGSHPA